MRTALFLLMAFFLGMIWQSAEGRSTFMPSKFQANFTQEYKSIVSGKIKRSNGKMDYEYPGKIRFEMVSPDPLLFISNDSKNWYYRPPFIDGEQGELKKNVKDGDMLSNFFDSLQKGLKDNLLYRVLKTDGDVKLKFKKNVNQQLSIDEALLTFNSRNKSSFMDLKKITLLYHSGKKTHIIFDQLNSAQSFPKGHFVFSLNE